MVGDQQPKPKLIVVVAFDPDGEGELQPVYGPAEQDGEDVRVAQALAGKHAGVTAWSRMADPAIGEYGEPTVLFQHGSVPAME